MHPVLIDFGLFKLHTYGLMIAIAFLVGMQLGTREARRVDLSKEKRFDAFILDLCFWILVVSMIGSRVLFIIVNWGKEYSSDPLKIFRVWEGGLVFYGGFLSAVLFSVYYSRKKGYDFFQVADVLIPSVALGAFFGRLGCFAAGCCWGETVSSDFALGVQFPAGSLIHSSMRAGGLISPDAPWTLHVHPVQLYDSFGELLIFFFLLAMRGQKRFHGQLLLLFLFIYPLHRSTLETLRGDSERGVYDIFGLPMSTSQIISVIVATSAILTLIYLRRKHPRIEAPAAAPS
jgi:phosphatidylglycerol---prolipoprotein diacylglyceryl transferase